MSKKGNIQLIIVVIIALLVGFFFYTKYLDTNEILDLYQQNSSMEKVSNDTSAHTAVNNYAKNSGYKKPVVTTDFIKDTQARGNISDEGVVGGAKWFAAKINGEWIVVWMGNGLPKCADIAKYNLPKDFLNCY